MAVCKLCRKDEELRESHFLPAAVYAQLRNDADRNPNPVVMTGKLSLTTSKQITARVLCGECEERFSKLGEAWVLANMARPEGFKIQEALIGAKPIQANENFAYYSSSSLPDIKMDMLVYFALSMFWRASAHTWRNASGPMEGIDLGPLEEEIRKFLLGQQFPTNTVILVTVWPTKNVFPAAYTPRRGKADGYHAFNFLIPGLEFKLMTGRMIPEMLRKICSHGSADKLIFSAMSIVSDTTDAFFSLASTSRESRALQEIRKSQ
jgi:hypothetical protein